MWTELIQLWTGRRDGLLWTR